MNQIANYVGFAGALIILFGFARTTLKDIAPDRIYHIANFTGASCLAFSLVFNFNLPALLLELAWAGIALFGLVRDWNE